jgi:hypothetical protein
MTHGSHLHNLLIPLISHPMGIYQDDDLPQPFFYLPHNDLFAYFRDNFGFPKDVFQDSLLDNLLFLVFLG